MEVFILIAAMILFPLVAFEIVRSFFGSTDAPKTAADLTKTPPKSLTREEKAGAAKRNLQKNKAIIEEAEISDPVVKKMAERFADKKFNQKLKSLIDDD